MSKQSLDSLCGIEYKVLRIVLHGYIMNFTPFRTPDWFTVSLNVLANIALSYSNVVSTSPMLLAFNLSSIPS